MKFYPMNKWISCALCIMHSQFWCDAFDSNPRIWMDIKNKPQFNNRNIRFISLKCIRFNARRIDVDIHILFKYAQALKPSSRWRYDIFRGSIACYRISFILELSNIFLYNLKHIARENSRKQNWYRWKMCVYIQHVSVITTHFRCSKTFQSMNQILNTIRVGCCLCELYRVRVRFPKWI